MTRRRVPGGALQPVADCDQEMCFGSGSWSSGADRVERVVGRRVGRHGGGERAPARGLLDLQPPAAAVQVAADRHDPARHRERPLARAEVRRAGRAAARDRVLRVRAVLARQHVEPQRLDRDDVRARVDGHAVLQQRVAGARLVVHHHPARAPAVAAPDRIAVAGREGQRAQLLARAVEALRRSGAPGRSGRAGPVAAAVRVDDVVQHDLVLGDLDARARDEPRVHPDDRAADGRRADDVGRPRHLVGADPVRPEAEDVRPEAGVGAVLRRRGGDRDEPRRVHPLVARARRCGQDEQRRDGGEQQARRPHPSRVCHGRRAGVPAARQRPPGRATARAASAHPRAQRVGGPGAVQPCREQPSGERVAGAGGVRAGHRRGRRADELAAVGPQRAVGAELHDDLARVRRERARGLGRVGAAAQGGGLVAVGQEQAGAGDPGQERVRRRRAASGAALEGSTETVRPAARAAASIARAAGREPGVQQRVARDVEVGGVRRAAAPAPAPRSPPRRAASSARRPARRARCRCPSRAPGSTASRTSTPSARSASAAARPATSSPTRPMSVTSAAHSREPGRQVRARAAAALDDRGRRVARVRDGSRRAWPRRRS